MDSSSVSIVADTVAPSQETRWSLLIHPLLTFCRCLLGFVRLQATFVNESAIDTLWISLGVAQARNLLFVHVLIELLVLMGSYYTCETHCTSYRSRVSLIHSLALVATLAELTLVTVLADVMRVSLTPYLQRIQL